MAELALKHLRGARKPVAYVLAYVHRDHPALRGVLDRRGIALHDFIEERIGERIVTVEQDFSAKPLRGSEAKALGGGEDGCGVGPAPGGALGEDPQLDSATMTATVATRAAAEATRTRPRHHGRP